MKKTARSVLCQPFAIDTKDAREGARFGGLAPEGVSPPMRNNKVEYLLTVPRGSAELSLFISLIYESRNPRCVWRSVKTVLDEQQGHVQAILHTPAKRSLSSRFKSSFEGHALRIDQPEADVDPEVGGPWASHKLGGVPVFYDSGSDLDDLAAAVMHSGYAHIIQLAPPSSRDAPVKGSWPFGESVLHVFGKTDGHDSSFRFIWG
jgi:hypothetical protein